MSIQGENKSPTDPQRGQKPPDTHWVAQRDEKPRYQAPLVFPLGETIRSLGACVTGSSAGGACNSGLAPTGACLGGAAPRGACLSGNSI
jgi:hypothetical protein